MLRDCERYHVTFFTLQELAEKLGCGWAGDPHLVVNHVCGLSRPTKGGLCYLSEKKNFDHLPHRSGVDGLSQTLDSLDDQIAIIVPKNLSSGKHHLIFSDDPLVTHVEAAHLLHPGKPGGGMIHETAVIGKDVRIGAKVTIEPHVVIYDHVVLGDHCYIGAGSILMENVSVGDDTKIFPNVVIREGSSIGCRVVIQSNAVIGSDGHGYFQREGVNYKLPQIGTVRIEDDVEIGACTTIDRGRLEPTVIGKGCKLDNQIQIGHNVELGPHGLISAQSAIGGSAKIGHHLVLAGQAGIIDHVSVGNHVTAVARTAITSHTEDGQTLAGMPSRDHHEWKVIEASLNRLKELFKRVRQLEKSKKVPSQP